MAKFTSAHDHPVTVTVHGQTIRFDPDEPFETDDEGVIEALEGQEDVKKARAGRKKEKDE